MSTSASAALSVAEPAFVPFNFGSSSGNGNIQKWARSVGR
jgi:hypothetical protein